MVKIITFASNHIISILHVHHKNLHENDLNEPTINKTYSSEPHVYPNLYPTHLTLLDITNFPLILNTDICNVKEISLVTIVHSAVNHQVSTQIVHIFIASCFCSLLGMFFVSHGDHQIFLAL